MSTSSKSMQPRQAPVGAGERRCHQLTEERVGTIGPALELRMGLGAHPERVTQAARRTRRAVRRVTRPNTAARLLRAADETAGSPRSGGGGARRRPLCRKPSRPASPGSSSSHICTEAHRPTHVVDVLLVGHQVDDGSRGRRIDLPRVGAVEPCEVPCHVDDHHLEPEAEPETWDLVLARVARRLRSSPRSPARRTHRG